MPALASVVLLLVLGEVFLPTIAERRLRDEIERNADGVAVDVKAFPAIKLLLGRADEVTVEVQEGRSGTGRLGDLLAKTKDTDELDARVATLESHGVPLQDVSLTKRGDTLVGQAEVRVADLDDALPARLRLQRSDGEGIHIEGRISALGVDVAAQFEIEAEGGAIVLRPSRDSFARILSFAIFRDNRVAVDTLDAAARNGRYAFTARARLTN